MDSIDSEWIVEVLVSLGHTWVEFPNIRQENVVMIGLRELDHDLPDWANSSEVSTEVQAIGESDALLT